MSKPSQSHAVAKHLTAAHIARSATEVACPPKETAAQFAHRELSQILSRLETTSNRLSAAKKRLQEHFGVPTSDSARVSDQKDAGLPMPQTMDGIRSWLDALDARFQSVADGMEELV